MITIKAEAHGGAEITRTAAEMQALSDKLGVIVDLDFNGVTCCAVPGGDESLLAERQQKSQRSKDQFKFATSRP